MTSKQETKHYGVVDTAKFIRKTLKANFPGQKFSVRSDQYSMGASIRIKWENGPTTKEVDAFVSVFAGSNFDGMIDLKYSIQAYEIQPGVFVPGRSEGTQGSMGVYPSYENEKPAGTQVVHFGADFVFTSRSLSNQAIMTIHKETTDELNPNIEAIPPIKLNNRSGRIVTTLDEIEDGETIYIDISVHGLHAAIHRAYNDAVTGTSFYIAPGTSSEDSNPPKDDPPSAPEAPSSTGADESGDYAASDATNFTTKTEREWTWIQFSDKPGETVRAKMKELYQARWSGGRKEWYIKFHVSAEQLAATI